MRFRGVVKLPSRARVTPAYSGATTAEAPKGNPWNMRAWHKARRTYLKSLKPTTFANGVFFVDFKNGNDSNDGRDGLGFNLSTATFTAATKTLTKTNAFTSYTPVSGDQIYISGGTAVTAGLYTVVSKTDASNIVLSADITTNASNPTDVTSSNGPWLTWDKVRTAGKLAVNNVSIRTAQGSDRVYRYTGDNNSVTSATGDATVWLVTGTNQVWDTYYPTNKTPSGTCRPRVTTFVLTTPGGWSADTAPRYKFTTAIISGVCAFKPNGSSTITYSLQTTNANCALREGSYFHNGTTQLDAYFQFSSNPTTGSITDYEYCPATKHFNGIGIEGGTTYFWIEGIDIEGFGAGTSSGAWYGIHSYHSGTETAIVKSCDVTYCSKHCIGHTSPSTGGIMVVEDCNVGWTSNAGNDTPIVSYASAGLNEWYAYNVGAYGGKVPGTTTALDTGGCCGQVMFTAHNTDGTTNCTMLINEKLWAYPSQYPVKGWGGSQNSPAIETDETLCSCYFLDCKYIGRTKSPQDGANSLDSTKIGGTNLGRCPINPFDGVRTEATTPPSWSTWYDGCYLESRLLWSPGDDTAQSSQMCKGFATNCTIIVDGQHVPPEVSSTAYALGFLDTGAATEINAGFYNCHFHFLVANGRDAGMVMRVVLADTAAVTPGNASANASSRLVIKDSIITFEGSKTGTWYLGINPATAANIVTNAFGTGTFKGFTSGGTTISGLKQRDWVPGQVPKVGDIDCTPTAFASGRFLTTDAVGNLRRGGTTAMGPLEAV